MESELNFLYFKVVSRSIPLTLWKGGEQQMKNGPFSDQKGGNKLLSVAKISARQVL